VPPEDSDLAEQILKDPYNFDFLALASTAKKRELQRGLLTHLRDLLLELGRGFAFVGSQVPLEVGGQSFYIDLLFYHLRLHCYFLIELKAVEFEPEHAGKLNFYISAVDEIMRTPVDGPTIGLLLCESRSGPVVEYALQKYRSAHWRIHLPGDAGAAGAFARKFRQWRISKRWLPSSGERWRPCDRSGRMKNNLFWGKGLSPQCGDNCAAACCTIAVASMVGWPAAGYEYSDYRLGALEQRTAAAGPTGSISYAQPQIARMRRDARL
jgi:hypothetical protein